MTARPLDPLIAALETGSDADWQRFTDAFALAEITLLLADEPGETARPRVLHLSDGPVALGFEGIERAAGFLSEASETLTARGAELAGLLTGAGLRLALNPGTDGAETVLTAEQLGWIADRYGAQVTREQPGRVRLGPPPRDALAPGLLGDLGTRLGAMAGVLSEAWLAGTDRGELVLVVLPGSGLPDVVVENATDLLTRAGQAAAETRFAVAVVDASAPALSVARQHGIGLLSEGTLTRATGR